MDLPKLKLPPFDPRLRSGEDSIWIWDVIRRKEVILTPEEWVRQHVIHLLVDHLDYPRSMIKVESGLEYNRKQKRADIKVYRGDRIFMLVECKSSDQKINDSTLNQISIYNKTLNSQFLSITNGMKTFVWEYKNGAFQQLTRFPDYRL